MYIGVYYGVLLASSRNLIWFSFIYVELWYLFPVQRLQA